MKQTRLYQAIASRITEARARTYMTQAELSRRTGLTKATINRFEKATSRPTIENLYKVAEALGLPSVEWLLPELEPGLHNEGGPGNE